MKIFLCFLVFGFFAPLVAGGQNRSADTQRDDGTVVINYLVLINDSENYLRTVSREFNESQDRIRVDIITAPRDVKDAYALLLQTFESQQSSIDLVPLDSIWPGDLAEHLIDLNTLGGAEMASQMSPVLVNNNTLDGRLLGMPAFNTTGLLYYRTDLLAKYGYEAPPATWDELEEMALTIQQGERAEGKNNFWGYVWQGQANESLVCNVLEWTSSNGDDLWINKDRQITINNPQTLAMLKRAKNWIGSITPPSVLASTEKESFAIFRIGDAAFMRNWFYAYSLSNAEGSEIKDLVGLSSVPAGDAGHGAATDGSWGLGISAYSEHPQESFEFIKFLLSPEKGLRRTKEISEFTPYTAHYQDEKVLAEIPILKSLQPVFENTVARPATVTAPNYSSVSTAVSSSVHDILADVVVVEDGLEELALDIQEITGFEIVDSF